MFDLNGVSNGMFEKYYMLGSGNVCSLIVMGVGECICLIVSMILLIGYLIEVFGNNFLVCIGSGESFVFFIMMVF